jgi:hypothetical protein
MGIKIEGGKEYILNAMQIIALAAWDVSFVCESSEQSWMNIFPCTLSHCI